MMKKFLCAAVLCAAVLLPHAAPAESVCADAGASNPLRGVVTLPQPHGVTIPAVCVWVP